MQKAKKGQGQREGERGEHKNCSIVGSEITGEPSLSNGSQPPLPPGDPDQKKRALLIRVPVLCSITAPHNASHTFSNE